MNQNRNEGGLTSGRDIQEVELENKWWMIKTKTKTKTKTQTKKQFISTSDPRTKNQDIIGNDINVCQEEIA